MPVGRAIDDEGVRRAGEPVDSGLGEHRVGRHGEPFNWNWHTFVWDQMLSELLILGLGVSAGFQGGLAVC